MGWFRRRQAANELERASSALERLEKLERTAAAHTALLEKLELDRPAFLASLEELGERCHDVLDQAERKRGRAAAAESRARRREAPPEGELELDERELAKANVRRVLAAKGLH